MDSRSSRNSTSTQTSSTSARVGGHAARSPAKRVPGRRSDRRHQAQQHLLLPVLADPPSTVHQPGGPRPAPESPPAHSRAKAQLPAQPAPPQPPMLVTPPLLARHGALAPIGPLFRALPAHAGQPSATPSPQPRKPASPARDVPARSPLAAKPLANPRASLCRQEHSLGPGAKRRRLGKCQMPSRKRPASQTNHADAALPTPGLVAHANFRPVQPSPAPAPALAASTRAAQTAAPPDSPPASKRRASSAPTSEGPAPAPVAGSGSRNDNDLDIDGGSSMPNANTTAGRKVPRPPQSKPVHPHDLDDATTSDEDDEGQPQAESSKGHRRAGLDMAADEPQTPQQASHGHTATESPLSSPDLKAVSDRHLTVDIFDAHKAFEPSPKSGRSSSGNPTANNPRCEGGGLAQSVSPVKSNVAMAAKAPLVNRVRGGADETVNLSSDSADVDLAYVGEAEIKSVGVAPADQQQRQHSSIASLHPRGNHSRITLNIETAPLDPLRSSARPMVTAGPGLAMSISQLQSQQQQQQQQHHQQQQQQHYQQQQPQQHQQQYQHRLRPHQQHSPHQHQQHLLGPSNSAFPSPVSAGPDTREAANAAATAIAHASSLRLQQHGRDAAQSMFTTHQAPSPPMLWAPPNYQILPSLPLSSHMHLNHPNTNTQTTISTMSREDFVQTTSPYGGTVAASAPSSNTMDSASFSGGSFPTSSFSSSSSSSSSVSNRPNPANYQVSGCLSNQPSPTGRSVLSAGGGPGGSLASSSSASSSPRAVFSGQAPLGGLQSSYQKLPRQHVGPGEADYPRGSNDPGMGASAHSSAAARLHGSSSGSLDNQDNATFEQERNESGGGAGPASEHEDDVQVWARHLFESSSGDDPASRDPSQGPAQNISIRDAYWFLDSLESYHVNKLVPMERNRLASSGLRAKPKHRHAVLFWDDYNFVFQYRDLIVFSESEFRASMSIDPRVFLLHEACKVVLKAYRWSLAHAPAKSCIWSAIMIRTAFHLERSGFSDIKIVDHVEGVQHKEATLYFQGYHISRSNFTKLCRGVLTKLTKTAKAQSEVLASASLADATSPTGEMGDMSKNPRGIR